MIISHRHAYVFVHIPKTGGTSMATALEDRVGPDDILIGDTAKAKRRRRRLKALQAPGRLWKHSTLADVEGLYPKSAFVFTLVRNPWDRMVSYYHWLKVQSFAHPAVKLAQTLDFEGFLMHPALQESVRQNGYQTYVKDAQGQERCNLFARLEHPEDLTPLWQNLGFELTFPHINASKRNADWRLYYDTQSFEIVAEIAANDIARFGYTHEL